MPDPLTLAHHHFIVSQRIHLLTHQMLEPILHPVTQTLATIIGEYIHKPDFQNSLYFRYLLGLESSEGIQTLFFPCKYQAPCVTLL